MGGPDMTRNVTLRMDAELLRTLRHQAVDSHQSLSAWIVTTLTRESKQDAGLTEVRARALQRLKQGFRLGGRPLSREEAHAR
jgi:hypothetical protein